MNVSVEADDYGSSTYIYFFFEDYTETTLDPGWSLVIGSLIACILLHATLPCMVSLRSRYERRRVKNHWHHRDSHEPEQSTDDDDDDDDDINARNEDHRQGNQYIDNDEDEFSIKKSRQPSILLERIHSQPEPDNNDAKMTTTTNGNKISMIVDDDFSSTSHDLETSDKSLHSTKKRKKRNQRTSKYHKSGMTVTPIDEEPEVNTDEENGSYPEVGRMCDDRNDSLRIKSLSPVNEKSVGNCYPPFWFGDGVMQWFCGMGETVRKNRSELSS